MTIKISSAHERIELGIKEFMNVFVLDRMPTSREFRDNGYSWLDALIGRNGGLLHWAEALSLPTKGNRTKRLTDDEIKNRLLQIMEVLKLDRMPSSSEIYTFPDGDKIHNSITRSYGYRDWAEKLGLELKDSETKLGNDFEEIVKKLLVDKGYKVTNMTQNHPFDILINDSVKVDVKTARPHMMRGEHRVHTFATGKKYGSCDLYMAVALNEKDDIEKLLIIPSHRIQIVTLCIGKKSKYDIYDQRFDLIDEYTEFFKSLD